MAAAKDDLSVLGLGFCHGLDGSHLSVLGDDYGLPGLCQVIILMTTGERKRWKASEIIRPTFLFGRIKLP